MANNYVAKDGNGNLLTFLATNTAGGMLVLHNLVDSSAVPYSNVYGQPTTPSQSNITGSVYGYSINSTSKAIIAASPRTLLSICNQSTNAVISVYFGGTASIGSFGGYDINPGQIIVWKNYPVPADSVNIISSISNSNVTIQVF